MGIEIKLGDKISFSAGKPPTKPLGYSGETWGNELTEQEYNTDLQGSKGIEQYEKMRRSDGAVKASLQAVKLPILRAEWQVEPVSERRADRKIAESVQKALFGSQNNWQTTLKEILTFLDFGFAVFEPVVSMSRDGVSLDKLALRPQETIEKFVTDTEGNLIAIEQLVMVAGSYKRIQIPVENLLIFSNEKEGKNWRGVSILRTAYKDWSMKCRFENLNAISADRYALGVPIITLPHGWTQEQENRAKLIGKNFRAHRQAYIILEEGMTFDVTKPAENRKSLVEEIRHHSEQITKNVLAGFLDLGTTETGSRAVAGELKEFFLMSLESTADHVAEVLNRHLLPRLTYWLHGENVQPPTLNARNIRQVNLAEWANMLKTLHDGGLLQIDEPLEQFVRTVADLPEIDLKKRDREKQQPLPEPQRPEEILPGEEEENKAAACGCTPKAAAQPGEFTPPRELHEWEQAVNWQKIASRQDKEFSNTGEIILDAEAEFKKRILSTGAKLTLKKLDKIDLENEKAVTALVQKMHAVEKFGRDMVRKEVSASKAAKKPRGNLLSIHENIARLALYRVAQRLKTNTADTLADTSWGELKPAEKEQLLKNNMDRLSDAVTANEGRKLVARAFAYGRDDEARQLKEDGLIKPTAYGSSILDGNLCDNCREDIDGREFTVGSDEYEEHLPPYSNCEGGDQCRCVMIYLGA